jgi:hypothetical protein
MTQIALFPKKPWYPCPFEILAEALNMGGLFIIKLKRPPLIVIKLMFQNDTSEVQIFFLEKTISQILSLVHWALITNCSNIKRILAHHDPKLSIWQQGSNFCWSTSRKKSNTQQQPEATQEI